MTTASETFALEGTRCAGCVLKIEQALAHLPGVELARGNATRHRMHLIWDADRQTADSLADAIHKLGYGAHRLVEVNQAANEPSLLPRLAVAGLGMMNIMMLSLSVWFGLATDMGAGTMHLFHWISAAIALPVVAYSGAVFHRPALKALRAGHMTMDTPITLGIWITVAASLWETARGADEVYFDAAVALIFFLLIGRVLEQAMHRKSGNAADNIRALIDKTAVVLDVDGRVRDVDVAELRTGDVLLIKTGQRVPADGQLLTELAAFDESALTGETLPRDLQAGDTVAAGTILAQGPAKLKVTHVGEASHLGRMAELIDEVTAHKGRLQKLSDRFARGYIPTVLGGGTLGFFLWYVVLGASLAEATMIAVAVLIVTCPCAAGLATPAVTSRAINQAMRAGVIVKSGAALENLAEVDRVFIDKTGTASNPTLLPEGKVPSAVMEGAMKLAASSQHPLARALLKGNVSAPLEGVVEHPGAGVEAHSGARLGSAAFVGAKPEPASGPTIFFRAPDGATSMIAFSESARADLPELLNGFRELAIPIELLSGDAAGAVQAFATRNDMAFAGAAQTPDDKLAQIKAAQQDGQTVLMIGDGINDSPALAAADVSVSFGGATEIAQNTADIVLTTPRLGAIPQAIQMAKQARMLIAQNLVFSTVYNFCAVPLALAGFLSPAVAALLMSASSLAVLLNGARLRSTL